MSTSHAQMRSVLAMAFKAEFNREASRNELQCLQAIAKLETNYGDGWQGAGAGSNNLGAIQKGSWTGATFTYTDTSPNPDGTSTPYKTEFRKYPTLFDGARDLVRVVYRNRRRDVLVLPAAAKGDLLAFSTALYETAYYEGFGRTKDERIAHHLKAVKDSIVKQATALGEPMPDGTMPPEPAPRTLRMGMAGEDVAKMQAIVGAKPDGVFGPKTRELVIRWQVKHRLKPDGFWGAVCRAEVELDWARQFADEEAPTLRDGEPPRS